MSEQPKRSDLYASVTPEETRASDDEAESLGYLKQAKQHYPSAAIALLVKAERCLREEQPLPPSVRRYLLEAFESILAGREDAEKALLLTIPNRRPADPRNDLTFALVVDGIRSGSGGAGYEVEVTEDTDKPPSAEALRMAARWWVNNGKGYLPAQVNGLRKKYNRGRK